MPSSNPRKKLTVEIIDELLAIHDCSIDDPDWDRYMELLWGAEKGDKGVMLDLLILARVALEHLNVVIAQGGPKDVRESPARNDSDASGATTPART